MEIKVKEVSSKRIIEIFKETAACYPQLKKVNLVLHQRKMKSTTMRAQPALLSLLVGTPTYKIEISNNTDLADHVKITEVPNEVLKGWFAHELGHVIDYLDRGFLGMLWFGIRYLRSKNFRIRTEHEADKIAVANGFSDSILATKKYILEHSALSAKYKARIKKYYLSANDIVALLEAEEHKELKLDDVDIFNTKEIEQQ